MSYLVNAAEILKISDRIAIETNRHLLNEDSRFLADIQSIIDSSPPRVIATKTKRSGSWRPKKDRNKKR